MPGRGAAGLFDRSRWDDRSSTPGLPGKRIEDRAVFIKALSTEAELPEKVDVVIADQIGYFGFDAGILEYFTDARERFLKPGGTLIPSRLDLFVAPVEFPDKWDDIESWNDSPAGFDFTMARSLAVNTSYPVKFQSQNLLGEPAAAVSLDLPKATTEPFEMKASIKTARSGILHGIGGWFSAELSPGVTMSNSPLARQPINRSNLFFPVDRSVILDEGDRVEIGMHVMPLDRVITWRVEVWAAGDDQQKGTPVKKASFAHSTWKGMLISREDLRRTRPDFVPALTSRGKISLMVLSLCNGAGSLSEIQQEVLRLHRDLFRSETEAAAFVADIVSRHCE